MKRRRQSEEDLVSIKASFNKSSNSSTTFQKEQISNVVQFLRRRSLGFKIWNSNQNLQLYTESCAALSCLNNHKVNLPPRSRSTFMTAFSPNQELMASCHGDHNVHITSLQSKKVVKSLVGHERTPWCISFHPSCSDILATGCLNGEVRVWDLRGGGSESWTSTSSERVTITSLSFHPTDHVLLIASGNEIHFWDWNFSKPFVSIKTNSIAERVQLVRFDAFGSRILTGIVNTDDDPNNSDHIDGQSDGFPSNPGVPHQRPQTPRAPGMMVSTWFSNAAPVLSITTRSPSSRPITASYNLRGRHDARALSSVDNLSPTREDSVRRRLADLRSRMNDNIASSRPQMSDTVASSTSRMNDNVASSTSRMNDNVASSTSRMNDNVASSRSRVNDNVASSTSRLNDNVASSHDHQQILHAQVNVQAEIQHQYHRLQQLRQERRRLEVRLRQLQHNQASTRQNDQGRFVSPRPAANRASSENQLEREAFHDYNEITELLASRVQEHLIQSLNDSAIEVSVDWQNRTSDPPPESPVVPVPQPTQAPPLPTSAPSTSSVFPTSFFASRAPPTGRSVPDNEPSFNSSYFRRRVRRAETARRLFARRRNYINNMWPLPETYHGPEEKTSFRLQWWDFSRLEMPEISRCDLNVAVRQCKIHNDSSVDLSKDGRKVAALIWSDNNPHLVQVGVFSLDKSNLGLLLYKKNFAPSQYAVCLSLSPLGNYLAVGLKYCSYLSEGLQGHRNTMAEVLKLGRLGEPESRSLVQQITHPDQSNSPHNYTSVNTIAWLPQVGHGLVYGTNTGDLRLCVTPRHSHPAPG